MRCLHYLPMSCSEVSFKRQKMSDLQTSSNALYWKFDISTFRLLGRELITDRITALFELVKNAYDANAQNVHVEFLGMQPLSDSSCIIIRDDGIGMSLTAIRTNWMVVGTNSKRTNRRSPAPMFRKVVGKKGVGRFAVDKLGSQLLLSSKQIGDDSLINLLIDWNDYEEKMAIADLQAVQHQEFVGQVDPPEKLAKPAPEPHYFTDVANRYWESPATPEQSGTCLKITSIRDPWTKLDIERAYKELSKLVSPLDKPTFPFNIFLRAPEYNILGNDPIENKAVRHATEEITLEHTETIQQRLKHVRGQLTVIPTPIPSFGPINFKLYYFDRQAKDLFKREYQGGSIDGIKIYRDGLIATPFAEYEDQDIKKRDILGIDKRRYSGFFDKVSSADLIGILTITDDDNPAIKDSTNRQDFEDNKEYRELKRFIIDQLEELEDFISYRRKVRNTIAQTDLRTANEGLKSFGGLVRDIKKEAPSFLQERLGVLESQSRQLQLNVNRGLKQFQDLKDEKVRQENLFFSLMSLQDYAFEIAHVVRTALARIMSFAEFFKNEYPNPKFDQYFLEYARSIYDEMSKLDSVLEFLLSYTKSNISFQAINVKELIEDLFFNKYKDLFIKKEIQAYVEIDKPLIITHNYKFLEDIIENLISNSVKAIEDNQDEKIIKCTSITGDDNFTLLFSDNGCGIQPEDRERVFNIYFTRTAEKGGAGMGLYIVKTRIQSMQGTVEVVESEFGERGTTVKIILPFASSKYVETA